MSKLKCFLIIALLFVFQVSEICAQQLGAPGERRGTGTVVLKAAQVIDGTGAEPDRKSTRLNSSHVVTSRMPSSA